MRWRLIMECDRPAALCRTIPARLCARRGASQTPPRYNHIRKIWERFAKASSRIGTPLFERWLRSELHAAADQIEPARGLPELRARITAGAAAMPYDPEMTFHRCPARECREQVPDKFLMCAPHWALVPGPFQRAVYAAIRDHGLGSAHLRAAHRAAIDAVNNRLEEADA